MMINSALCRSARSLVEVSRSKLSIRSGVAEAKIAKFENDGLALSHSAAEAIRKALEAFGAVFLRENGRGVGVRLKFTDLDAHHLARLEGEGGIAADDWVPRK